MFAKPFPRAALGVAAAVALLVSAAPVGSSTTTGSTTAPAGGDSSGSDITTQNPISGPFSDTYADPAILRGKDGWWYMYATSDPLHDGDSPFGIMHVARTKDFSEWEYLGNIFEEGETPEWATSDSMFWAPDIRYVDGEYVLYYTVTDTVADEGDMNYAIGVATAPTPTGPWTDSGGPVVAPRTDENGEYLNTIDPAMFVDDDGTRYLYFGGYEGGVWVTELDESGTRALGEPTQVAHADRYEGAFVVKRGGYYYLTASSANCCAGPVTGYSVYAGRSTSPLGPFVDHEGASMMDSRVGGTQVIAQNGNRWIGVGHHAFFTDLAGQGHILYHGIDRNNAWLNEPGGVNRRPTLIDRLDWVGSERDNDPGWPVARAGAGPSDTPQPAPATATSLGIDSAAPASNDAFDVETGDWMSGDDTTGDAGTIARLVPEDEQATVTTRDRAPREARVETDVRGDSRFAVELGGALANDVTATVDPKAGELVIETRQGLRSTRDVAPLPDRYDPDVWSTLVVDMRAGHATARLTESRLGDVDAEVSVELARGAAIPRPVTLSAAGGEAQLDNLSVVKAHTPVTERAPEPDAGAVQFSEEFDTELDDSWNWVRPDGSAEVGDGTLDWQLGDGDLVDSDNTGPLLLRDQPAGDWIAETKLNLDLGVDTVRNHQQAGMIVRIDDDNFLRLGETAIQGTRQVEFGKEIDEDGTLRWGGHLGGPAADTMWLRIAHSTDADTGEHQYRSATSRDGETWRWGATWTLPADAEPQLGLYAGGGAEPATVASFDYLRFHKKN